jgi:Ca2+-binding RTX toxin-like protein
MLRIHSNRRFATLDDFQFPASALQSTFVPAIAALPDGGFVTAWMTGSGNSLAITAQLYNRNGRTIGNEFAVSPGAAETHTPDVATLSSGGFVVSWTANGSIMGRLYDAAGVAVGTQFTANTTLNGVQATSRVAALAGGGFVITWHDSHNGTFDNIHGQVFAANGTKVGGEFIGGDPLPGVEEYPDLVALSGGGFVISWFHSSADSRAQIFDAAGNRLGTTFTLNTITDGSQQSAELAALPGGGFVAIWLNAGGEASDQGVWAQRFDASGNKIGDDIHVDTGSDMANVTAIPGVGFAVAWKELSDPSSETYGHLRMQIFDFDGNRTGEEFSVAPDLKSIQNAPDITALASGAILVNWLNWVPQAGIENPHATIFFPTTLGTADADVMTGTANRDVLVGLEGPDQLTGGGEGDGLAGGAGDDRLFGGDGNDTLVGGSGVDWMEGGAGADIFGFETAGDSLGYVLRSDGKQLMPDVIVDFVKGTDKIDLSAIDANAGTAANDAFTFIGSGAFDHAGQLRVESNAPGLTSIFADTDGNGSADLHIVLLTAVFLTADDFVL